MDINNLGQLGFIAYCVDKARGMSTPDMRLPGDMTGIILEKFSKQWLAGTNSMFGPSGVPTGVGVVEAMKQAVKFKLGKDSLAGISVAVQGLGGVGGTIADLLVKENAKLYVADFDHPTAEKFKANNPNGDITTVAADQIMDIEADVFCPCAAGGIISEENIPKLKFQVIIGGANNQLKATSQEGEIRLARMLEDRGILYQIDWWHNCGGVIAAIEEYERGEQTSLEEILEKVKKRISSQTLRKLTEAKEKSLSPTEVIFMECNDIIYGDKKANNV